jgi:cellulose synthase/poly-beta-1,6-N-acetylglucosamine synthase-like glycosyltransferase
MILEILLLIFSVIFAAYTFRHLVFVGVVGLQRDNRADFQGHAGLFLPTVTVIIAARNEERVIGRLLRRITCFTYPREKLDIIIVDDSSTDSTGRIVDDFVQQHPYFSTIHRVEGGRGKSNCLNVAFPNASGDIIVVFDADYYPQLDLLEKLVCYFVDPQVAIAQGRVTVLNEKESIVTRLVALERTSGYVIDQVARDRLDLTPQYAGTVAAIRRTFLQATGGWDESILAEDTDLTLEAVTMGWKVRYTTAAESYEEAVSTWRAYRRQRRRWAYGHTQCALKHLVPVLSTRHLGIRQKVDALLMMGVYMVPFLVGLGWVLGVAMVLVGSSLFPPIFLAAQAIFLFGTVGNFAPFFEVVCSMRLDRRSMRLGDLVVLAIGFVFNVAISVDALISLFKDRLVGERLVWVPTVHTGGA